MGGAFASENNLNATDDGLTGDSMLVDTLNEQENQDSTDSLYLNSNFDEEGIMSEGEVADTTAPVITYITPSTTFEDNITVEIECDDDNATIYYTLDGSNPINSSSRLIYKMPFVLNESATIHVTAIDNAGNYAQANYTWLNPGISDIFIYKKIQYYGLAITYLKKQNNTDLEVIWGNYQYNNGKSNFNGSLTNLTRWSNYEITSSGSAVIDKNGHIYIGSDDGYLYCLNNQGLVIWRYGTYSSIICTPTIGPDGNIYFANWMNSSLYCISPEGKLIWKYLLGNYNDGSSPIFGNDGSLYIVCGIESKSILYSFNNYQLKWFCEIPHISGSTPAISSDGTIYLLSDQHELMAINWDGTLKYSFSLVGLSNKGTPIHQTVNGLEESQVSVMIDSEGTFYVLNQPHYDSTLTETFIRSYYPDGSIKWYNSKEKLHIKNKYINKEYHYSVYGSPTLNDGILYINERENLMAINCTNGIILWTSPVKEAISTASSPLISNDGVIYLTRENVVYAFDLTGKQLWNYTISGKYGDPISFSSPVLSDDGTLIVTTNQGIFAFNDISAEFKYEHVNNTERTIQFTDTSTPGDNRYYWSFGDGFYSSEQNPSHVYANPGKYRVELLVEHDGITLARNTTITVETWDITPPSPVILTIDNKTSKGGVFNQTQIVVLSASDDYAVKSIYYTVDGSNPIDSETRRIYVEPISIETYTILKAVAVDTSDNWGEVSTFTFDITDSINVNDKINSSLIQKIQELLDLAEEGSKFVFDYDTLYGANFTINKPLNIITTNNTKLIGNGIQPVFTVTENAKGSSINGFTIVNEGSDGILIKNTNNVLVKDSIIKASDCVGINIVNSSQITVKDTFVDSSVNGILVNGSNDTLLQRVDVENSQDNGVWILNSQKTILKDSILENNGKDPYFSSAHQVLLDGSKDISILGNVINYGVFGVRLRNNNDGVVMDGNTIFEGSGDGIHLGGRFSNVNITHNDIDGSFIGLNFNGYSENVYVAHNLIHNNRAHSGSPDSGAEYDAFYGFKHVSDLYGQYSNCIEVFELARNFDGEVTIIDNVCIKTNHRAWEARKAGCAVDSSCAGVGYNLFDGSSAYQGISTGTMFYTPGRVDLVVDRIGDATYRLRLINRLDGHYLSELPEFDVKFTIGSYYQTVKWNDNQAVATFDVAAAVTSVTATISSYISKTISWDIPITDGYSSSNKEFDPGYEAGEAINNPDPKVPSIDEYIRSHQTGGNGNGNGQGQGNGNGNGNGNGGSYGTHDGAQKGREGDVEGNADNLVRSSTGTSAAIGVSEAQTGHDSNTEGGSSGEAENNPNSYEVKKVIDIENNKVNIATLIVLLLAVFFFIIGWRRNGNDDEEL